MLSTPSIFPDNFPEIEKDGEFFNTWNQRFWSTNTKLHTIIWIIGVIAFAMDTFLYKYIKKYFIDLLRNDTNVVSMKLYEEN